MTTDAFYIFCKCKTLGIYVFPKFIKHPDHVDQKLCLCSKNSSLMLTKICTIILEMSWFYLNSIYILFGNNVWIKFPGQFLTVRRN